MAKIQISFVRYIQKPKRLRLQISPQDKFNRLAKRLKSKGKNFQLRKFHFNAIEAGATIIVFDGEGIEAVQKENSRNGYIEARLHCLNMFFASNNQNGGFSFTTNANLEFQTVQELEKMRKLASSQTNTVIHCEHCKFRFDNVEERTLHVCNSDNKEKGWIIFEFPKPRRRIYSHAS